MFLFLACLTSIINASFAQEYYPKKAYTLGTDTFHFNQTYTAKLSKKHYSCDEYYKLSRELYQQQFQVYKYAESLADSLSKVEYPCFEYEVDFICSTELLDIANELTNSSDNCLMMRVSHGATCYRYSVNITKKRKSKINLSSDESTVFCPDEFYRQ